MPCLSCGDSGEERSGCFSRCLARRRRRQPPPPSSIGQSQQNTQSNSEIELTGTAAPNVERSQLAPRTGYVTRPSSTREAQEDLGNRGVGRVVSPGALHLQRGQRAPGSSSTRQQLALPAAASRGAERQQAFRSDGTEQGFSPGPTAYGEARLHATRGRSLGQQRIYSWPRRVEHVQNASRSGPTQQQTGHSGVGGQSSTHGGMAQPRQVDSGAGTPQRAGQAHRGIGWLTPPLQQAPAADLRNTVVAYTGSLIDQPETISEFVEDMCTFRVLIDAHFLIAPKSDEHDRPTVESFLRSLTEGHNKELPWPHPAMAVLERPGIPQGDVKTWGVHMESLYPPSISVPRKLNLISPLLSASGEVPGNQHVEVEIVERTWEYLNKHYEIRADVQSYNQIYINIEPPWTSVQIKRIAQAVIHFEPALDLLAPYGSRTGWHRLPGSGNRMNDSASSLSNTSRRERMHNKTRAHSIAEIEDVVGTRQVLKLVQERGHADFRWHAYDRYYIIWRLVKESTQHKNFAASLVAANVETWADLAQSFIQAAIDCQSPQQLQKIAPHHEGLRQFVTAKHTPPGSTNLPASDRSYSSRRA